MAPSWMREKAWADSLWDDVEAIIRRVAGSIVTVLPAGLEDDQKHARDYVVASGTIACRLRRKTGYRDVTIRATRPRTGNETELAKFIRGDVKWMLYGWTDEAHIASWVFVDVGKLIAAELHADRPLIPNYDGWSEFIAIPVKEIADAGAVVDLSGINRIRPPGLVP